MRKRAREACAPDARPSERQCSQCHARLPANRSHTYCRSCLSAYASEAIAKKRRVSVSDLVDEIATAEQQWSMLSRIVRNRKQWAASDDEEAAVEQLKNQLISQNYRCAVTGALLSSLSMSLWKRERVFVLPLVNTLLSSFGNTPSRVMADCIAQWRPEGDDAPSPSPPPPPEAVAAYVERMIRNCIGYSSTSKAIFIDAQAGVTAAALSGTLDKINHRCRATGIAFTYCCSSKWPSNPVLLTISPPAQSSRPRRRLVTALYWRVKPLQEMVPQMQALQLWWRRLPAPESQSLRAFFRDNSLYRPLQTDASDEE